MLPMADKAKEAFNYIELMRKGGKVKRFHTESIIGEETVGQHTYGVITWVMALADNKASRNLILVALYHDIDEQKYGDIPGPTKWENKKLSEAIKVERNIFRANNHLDILLSEEEYLTYKWADKMDLLMTCLDQEILGNSDCIRIGRKVVNKLETFKKHSIGTDMLKIFLLRHPQYCSNDMPRGEYYDY